MIYQRILIICILFTVFILFQKLYKYRMPEAKIGLEIIERQLNYVNDNSRWQ